MTPIKILAENVLLILGTVVGGLAAGWQGALIMGFVGMTLDSFFQSRILEERV